MTRARLLVRSLLLGFVLIGPALAISCGGDSKTTPPPASGGSGNGMPEVMPIECGATTCNPVKLFKGLDPEAIPACCPGGDACGLDSTPLNAYGVSFAEACQALEQPGDATTACPDSPPLTVPNAGLPLTFDPFKGCCRPESKTCGYLLNDLVKGVIELGLGCVDSSPFLDGGTAPACDPGDGAAGAGG